MIGQDDRLDLQTLAQRLVHSFDESVGWRPELVEVVPGHICVQVEMLGGLGCRDAVVAGVGEQEDVATSRIAERCRDRRDRGRKLGGREITSTGIWNGFDDTIDDRCAFSLRENKMTINVKRKGRTRATAH